MPIFPPLSNPTDNTGCDNPLVITNPPQCPIQKTRTVCEPKVVQTCKCDNAGPKNPSIPAGWEVIEVGEDGSGGYTGNYPRGTATIDPTSQTVTLNGLPSSWNPPSYYYTGYLELRLNCPDGSYTILDSWTSRNGQPTDSNDPRNSGGTRNFISPQIINSCGSSYPPPVLTSIDTQQACSQAASTYSDYIIFWSCVDTVQETCTEITETEYVDAEGYIDEAAAPGWLALGAWFSRQPPVPEITPEMRGYYLQNQMNKLYPSDKQFFDWNSVTISDKGEVSIKLNRVFKDADGTQWLLPSDFPKDITDPTKIAETLQKTVPNLGDSPYGIRNDISWDPKTSRFVNQELYMTKFNKVAAKMRADIDDIISRKTKFTDAIADMLKKSKGLVKVSVKNGSKICRALPAVGAFMAAYTAATEGLGAGLEEFFLDDPINQTVLGIWNSTGSGPIGNAEIQWECPDTGGNNSGGFGGGLDGGGRTPKPIPDLRSRDSNPSLQNPSTSINVPNLMNAPSIIRNNATLQMNSGLPLQTFPILKIPKGSPEITGPGFPTPPEPRPISGPGFRTPPAPEPIYYPFSRD